MKSNWFSKYGVMAIVLGILLIISVSILLINRVNAEPKLTIDRAITQVREQYQGEIVGAVQAGDRYIVQLRTETGLYEIVVNSNTNGFVDIKRMETYDPTPINQNPGTSVGVGVGNVEDGLPDGSFSSGGPQPQPTGQDSSTPIKEVLINREAAIAIAQEKVGGKVDQTELRELGGVRYYIVEVELPDDREAKIQLNAASGAIMSITWDDDDYDDDDDNDDDDN